MVNINGHLFESKKSVIHLDNRGLNYGDAVFETMRLLDGRIIFWKDHHSRLINSMGLLRMKIPKNFTMDFLHEEILKTIGKQDVSAQRIKLLVWRKAGGKYGPENCEIDYAISFEPLESRSYVLNKEPYKVGLYTEYSVSSDLLTTLKTNNKIINVVGSVFAQDNNYDNCLLLNEKKQLVGALNGNLFLVFGNHIKTPSIAQGCLNGVLRKQLLDVLKSHPEISVEEVSIDPDELAKADELMITNVISGITSVTKYDKINYGNSTAKKLLSILNARAAAN